MNIVKDGMKSAEQSAPKLPLGCMGNGPMPHLGATANIERGPIGAR